MKICSICGNPFAEFGNHAWPINEGRCCDECNKLVIERRITDLRSARRRGRVCQHRDSGRGVCIDCGEFLPTGDHWAGGTP
jgi:hypothetical protein